MRRGLWIRMYGSRRMNGLCSQAFIELLQCRITAMSTKYRPRRWREHRSQKWTLAKFRVWIARGNFKKRNRSSKGWVGRAA